MIFDRIHELGQLKKQFSLLVSSLRWPRISVLLFLVTLSLNSLAKEAMDVNRAITDESVMSFMSWNKAQTLNWHEADHEQWQSLNQANFGYYHQPIWTKLTLFNSSSSPQNLILYNSHPGMDDLHVTLVYHGAKLSQRPNPQETRVEQFQLGLLYPVKQQPIEHRLSALPLNLAPYSYITVYARAYSLGSMQVDWRIANPTNFFKTSLIVDVFWGLFGGLILCLAAYNFLVMRSLSAGLLGPYLIFAILTLYYQYSIKGVMRFEPTGWISQEWISFSTWYVPFLLLIALASLAMRLFNTRTNLPKVHRALQVFVILYALVAAFHILGAWFPWALDYPEPGLLIAFIGFILPVVVASIVFYKGLPGAQYFFMGQFFLAAGHLIQLGVLLGWVPNTTLVSFSVPVGILLDIVFLMFAFSTHMEQIQLAAKRQRELMLVQARFSSMGQAFGTISHAWKGPVIQLKALIDVFEDKLFTDSHKKELLSDIEKLNFHLNSLDHIVERFRYFYRQEHETNTFNLLTIILTVKELLTEKMAAYSIELKIDVPTDIVLKGESAHFTHLIMLILDATLNESGCQNQITLSTHKTKESIELKFCSAKSLQEFIQQDSGIAELNLMIAKILVEERLHGELVLPTVSKSCVLIKIP
ncbi:MAG: sensor histidine kinase [Gammaproteobacteria bacterium]|nr:sensor histidine kinase [Gammaproteobacteria bacterium]